jgi:uroporphyrinogen III methyltransferase/synthase
VTVYLVGAGPGDPGLLTRRGAELLSQADVVIFDRLVHHSVLALAPESAELIDVGKRPDTVPGGAARQDEINRLLVEHGQRHQVVVRLKGGDPFLFGRGGEEAEVLTGAGVHWEVVPGVTSAFGVPAAAGIPVTQRGLASSVTVVTGRVGDPTAAGGVDWEALAQLEGTLVILMGMQSRSEIAGALQRGGKRGDTPTAVIEQGTTPSQRVVRTTLDQLAQVELGSPSVIVVGPVAALGADQMAPARTGPLSGRTVVVTRPGARAHGLLTALHRAGAETIALPLTEQVGPEDGGAAFRAATNELGRYRWVVLTSVNAVQRFMGALPDVRVLATTLVAAVGPATAEALRQSGVQPDLTPAEHSGSGLVAEFPRAEPGSIDNLVLFPSADRAATTVPEGLAEKGWEVVRVEAYRTVALPPPEPEVLERMAGADAVTFTATSAVQAFAALRTPDGGSPTVPPLVVCIGPTTAQSARSSGLANVQEADGASTAGLVQSLIAHLAGPGPGGP